MLGYHPVCFGKGWSKQDKVLYHEEDSQGGIRDSNMAEYSSDTVQAGGNGAPYVIKEINPKVSGVLVLAEGAKSASVKNEIYEAVEALFDLEVHKIKVLEAE